MAAANIIMPSMADQTTPRAARKTKLEWEKYRPLIVSYYRKMTLEDVMSVMKEQHGFHATKRQYVFRLGQKWNEKKYCQAKSPGKKRPGSPGVLDEDSLLGPTTKRRRPSDSPMSPQGHGFSLGAPTSSYLTKSSCLPSPVSPNGSSAYHFTNEDALSDSVDADMEGGHGREIELPWDLREDNNKRAADFLFALSDDEISFPLYEAGYKALLESGHEVDSLGVRLAIIACARSAQLEEHAMKAHWILEEHLKSVLDEKTTFLFRILDAYTFDRVDKEESKQEAATLFREIVPSVLEDPEGRQQGLKKRLGDSSVSIDMVMYNFLSYGLENFFSKDSDRAGKIAAILEQYGCHQPVIKALLNDGDVDEHQSLKSCVRWCAQCLESMPEVPPLVEEIPCDEIHRTWRDHIRISCCLWGLLQKQRINHAPLPVWVQRSEQELRISHAELLVAICWLIIINSANDGDSKKTSGRGRPRSLSRCGPTPEPEDMVRRAADCARVMVSWANDQLWHYFLERFLWMNDLVELNNEDKRFKEHAMAKVREFVQETLHVNLGMAEASSDDDDEDAWSVDNNLGMDGEADVDDLSDMPMSQLMPPGMELDRPGPLLTIGSDDGCDAVGSVNMKRRVSEMEKGVGGLEIS